MSGPAPLIGLTTYPPNDADRFELGAAYVAAVRRAGGRPLLIPPGDPDPAAVLDLIDGLVLTGGGDVDPARYGAGPHPSVDRVDAARDRLELALAEGTMARPIPTLAICRGMQIVNVAAGGSLIVDLDSCPDRTVEHRRVPREAVPHAVAVEPGALVARVMGTPTAAPMSLHHQAVDRPGVGFRVVGRAPDGVVEAIEHADHPWLAAVQWHPEMSAETDPTQQALFDGLIAAATGGRW